MSKKKIADIATLLGWLVALIVTTVYLKGYGMPTIPVTLISALSSTGVAVLTRDIFYKKFVR